LCCFVGLYKRPTTGGGRVARDRNFGLEGTVWQPLHFRVGLVASLLLPSVEVFEEAAPDDTAMEIKCKINVVWVLQKELDGHLPSIKIYLIFHGGRE
jgi:hypothetical protein